MQFVLDAKFDRCRLAPGNLLQAQGCEILCHVRVRGVSSLSRALSCIASTRPA